jgi:epoxyqueuosine reductase
MMSIKMKLQKSMKRVLIDNVMVHLEDQEASISDMPGAVCASEVSPKRFDILRNSLHVTRPHPALPGFPQSVPQIASSLHNIHQSMKELADNPQPYRTQITDDELRNLEAFMESVGVDDFGYTTVPEVFVFADKAVLHRNAIVLTMEMSKTEMEKAPSHDTGLMVHETYNALGIASNKIARYLREQGFSAHAGHPLMGMALYPPLAQAAGLGWRGMHGLLITPRFGPRVRLAAVFVSIDNLPPAQENDHAWIEEFCNHCRVCAKKCPGDAVLTEPIVHENGQITCTDNEKCFPWFIADHGCSVCIKVCPFNRAAYEKLHASHDHQMNAVATEA